MDSAMVSSSNDSWYNWGPRIRSSSLTTLTGMRADTLDISVIRGADSSISMSIWSAMVCLSFSGIGLSRMSRTSSLDRITLAGDSSGSSSSVCSANVLRTSRFWNMAYNSAAATLAVSGS